MNLDLYLDLHCYKAVAVTLQSKKLGLGLGLCAWAWASLSITWLSGYKAVENKHDCKLNIMESVEK